MSTIKSSAENLTLNADGANNDIKFQSNGSEVASIDQAGVITASGVSLAASGTLTTASGNDLNIVYPDSRSLFIKEAGTTHVAVDNTGNVGIGTSSPAQKLDIQDSNYGVRISPVASSKFVRIQLPTNEGNALDTEKYIIAYNGSHSGNPHTLALKSNNSAGNLGFFTNNSENMTIAANGAVTMPKQPSFWVSGTAASGMVSYASNAEIVFSNAQSNTGSYYNTSTGRFTAPVAGAYLFSGTLQGAKASNYRWTIKKNGVQFGSGGANSDCVPHGYNVDVGQTTNTIVLQLAANDYVSCAVRTGQAMAVYGGHSYFSGVLVG